MNYFNTDFLNFLADLEFNNNKEWFDLNRKRYEKCVKEPFELFTKDLLYGLKEFDNELDDDYKKSIFRINRDIRFSKDKTPYKVSRSAAFSKCGKKDTANPGYYIDLNLKNSFIAGGAWNPSKEHLQSIRLYIYNNMNEYLDLINEKEFNNIFENLKGDKAKRLLGSLKNVSSNEFEIIYQKQFYFLYNFDVEDILKNDFLNKMVMNFKAGYKMNIFLRKIMA